MGCCGSKTLSNEEKLHILSNTPLFSIDYTELTVLSSYFDCMWCKQGQIITRAQDEADRLYVVAQGTVQVSATDESDQEVILCTKQKGDFLAHEGLLEDHLHFSSTSRVTSPKAMLLYITHTKFKMYLDRAPADIHKSICSIVATPMSEILSTVPFLQGTTKAKLNILGSLFRYTVLPAGNTLFNQGDTANAFYVCVNGLLRVSKEDDEGDLRDIALIRPGQGLGEIALMTNMPRTAAVSAKEDSLLVMLDKGYFQRFLTLVPELTKSFELLTKTRCAKQFKTFDVPFFQAIPDELYVELAEICEIEHFSANQTVFEQGEPGNKFYIIVHGHVEVSKRDKFGDMNFVTSLGPGRYFGEIALVLEQDRTATIVARDDSVMLSISQERFKGFFDTYPECFADFELKLLKKDSRLSAVLYHRSGHKYFAAHVEKEYSGENIHFWDDVEAFKKDPTLIQAQHIIEKYIVDNAPEQVNINHGQRQTIIQKVADNDVMSDIFNEAQREILALMSKDTFSRFKMTTQFQQLLKEVNAYVENTVMTPVHTRALSRQPTQESVCLSPRPSPRQSLSGPSAFTFGLHESDSNSHISFNETTVEEAVEEEDEEGEDDEEQESTHVHQVEISIHDAD